MLLAATLIHLLAMPRYGHRQMPNPTETRDKWSDEVTRGHTLFQALHDAVKKGQVGEAANWLLDWKDYVARDEKTQKQFDIAHALVWCADRASRQPDFYCSNTDRVSFDPDCGALPRFVEACKVWAQVCIRTFLDAPSRRVELPVAKWDETKGEAGGSLNTLVLEVLEGGEGQTVHHPVDVFVSDFDALGQGFLPAMRDAWKAAIQTFRDFRSTGRWRLLEGWHQDPRKREKLSPVTGAQGRSASGQAARGWWFALRGEKPDERIVTIAMVNEKNVQWLEGVDDQGVRAKAKVIAADAQRSFDTIVAVSDSNVGTAEQVLRETGSGKWIRVRQVRCLTDLVAVQSLAAERVQLHRQHLKFLKKYHSRKVDVWDKDFHWQSMDRVIEMCYAPNLWEPHTGGGEVGWEPQDVFLSVAGDFPNAPRLERNYQQWRERVGKNRLDKDGTKFVLVNHPTSMTDEHNVRLAVKKTKWSWGQAARSAIEDRENGRELLFSLADPQYQRGRKPRIDLAASEFSHSFCLHGIVITSDDKVLSVQRPASDRTDYHANAWAFSFEEQLAAEDFSGAESEDEVFVCWLRRAVRQEVLGEKGMGAYFREYKTKVLSVAIEEEIFNPFLVALIRVDCPSSELAAILPTAPDRFELQNFKFFSVKPLSDDLINIFRSGKHMDGNSLHPTARYRLYLALRALLPSDEFDDFVRRCS
jgi:hypothetical protein